MTNPLSQESFKDVMRCWSSGVAIVSSAYDNVLRGMTVSSFASASLEPPLISVCCDHKARTLEWIQRSSVLALSILAEGQAELSNRFATKELEDVRFEGVPFTLGSNGCPLIDGAAAHLECTVTGMHPAGDHQLILALVTQGAASLARPLLYWNGGYGGFHST